MNRESTASPVFFERNRVARVYRGGALFHGFFGDPDEDGLFPEEWIASTVRALNRAGSDPLEGISLLEGTSLPFTDYLAVNPEALGARRNLDLLVKVLDSAIRLPIQAHPDKEFARKHFKSEHGKTEMWVVLATRRDAKVYLGFKQQISISEFTAAVNAGEKDGSRLVSLLNSVPVEPGDIYFVAPRTVHAIGAGCLILEIQEPTDFTLQPEAWCGDYRLDEYEKYLGLAPEVAFDSFDFESFVGEAAVQRARLVPQVIHSESTVTIERLVGSEHTSDFVVNRYTVRHGHTPLPPGPSIFVVVDGDGTLSSVSGGRGIQKGSYFFQPAGAVEVAVETGNDVTLIECLPR